MTIRNSVQVNKQSEKNLTEIFRNKFFYFLCTILVYSHVKKPINMPFRIYIVIERLHCDFLSKSSNESVKANPKMFLFIHMFYASESPTILQ